MKKALLLHGWEGTSQSHWFPWLKSELETRWYEVEVPNLPETDTPILEDQVDFLKNFSLWKREYPKGEGLKEDGDFRDGDIIVAHSLGCQVWLKYIEEKNISGLNVVFVAPSYNNLADELWEDRLDGLFYTMSNAFNTQNDFRLLKKQKNSYTVLLSNDDPYINSFSAREFYGQLDSIKFVELEWRWHFSSDVWLLRLSEVLEYIKIV